MKAYEIKGFISETKGNHFITKFGGQPDWIVKPQWPVSPAWDNRLLKFIGQIRLNDFYPELKDVALAYLFMTQPADRDDDFYDPDIVFPDEGENAVIIQPDGSIPECICVENHISGPTVDDKKIWIPQTAIIEETAATEFKEIDKDKFCGIPAVFQHSEISPDSCLLLQMHTNWLPFYLNAGDAPTMLVFLKEGKKEGFILIENL